MHWRRSCSAFFDAVFIRSSARPNCAGSRPLLAAAATTKRKGRVRRSLPIFLYLTLAQFTLGRLHSLPLLTGRGYFYPKKFGNRLRAREGKQPVSTICKPVDSKTRTYHGRVGTGRRTAGPRGGAGTSKTGCRRVGSPRRQPTPPPSRRSRQPSGACLWKHEQAKSYVNRRGKKTSG